MAEIGSVLLLFTVGLETRLSDLKRVGRSATLVGVSGAILPFALGSVWLVLSPAVGFIALIALMGTRVMKGSSRALSTQSVRRTKTRHQARLPVSWLTHRAAGTRARGRRASQRPFT